MSTGPFARVNSVDVYQVNRESLRPGRYYLFFPCDYVDEMVVTTVFDNVVFRHTDRSLAFLFDIEAVKLGSRHFCWASFPKEYKEICSRIAKVFGITLASQAESNGAPFITISIKGLIVIVPNDERVLYCSGRKKTRQELQEEFDRVEAFTQSYPSIEYFEQNFRV